MHSSRIFATLAVAYPCLAQYSLKWNYDSTNMMDQFDFYNGTDKYNKGFAQYLPKEDALDSGLFKTVDNKVYIGVDHENTYPQKKAPETLEGWEEYTESRGRNSVRMTSNELFDNGLLVGDFAHVPVMGNGMWPAYWVYRGEEVEDEKEYSEIDLIENVNYETAGVLSFYTGENCSVNAVRGKVEEESKLWCLHNGDLTEGCRFIGEENTFGKAFNDNHYRYNVLLIEADAIKVWWFKDGEAPSDLDSEHPDPSQWTAEPNVHLTPDDCDFAKQFSRFHVVINLTFCGDWAKIDPYFESEAECIKWVAENPKDFEETFWEINSVKLFQKAQQGYTV